MISRPIETLITKLKTQKGIIPHSPNDTLINVHKLTEKAGAAYEKLRYLVDYKDERHIRRSAIERIIKRKVIFEGGTGIGLSLIQELIAGRYLLNNSIPEMVAVDVEKIIRKYKKIENFLPRSSFTPSRSQKIIVSLMASEIEAFFYPNNEDDFVADAFFDTVKDSIKVGSSVSEEELESQVAIACYRGLLHVDDETLFYKFWLRYLPPEWPNLESDVAIKNIAENCPAIWHSIHASLKHPLSFKLLPRLNNYAIYFSVIREVVRAYGAESERVFIDSATLAHFSREFLEKNYLKQYKKARASAVRAVFFILTTKILLALAIELPYQWYFEHGIEYAPIATNVLFHPALLLFMTISVRPLGDKNTSAIIHGVGDVIAGENIKIIKVRDKGVGVIYSFFLMMYAVLFLIVFGFIVFVLNKFNWSIVSILLFLSFLTLVSYFALRIRHSANKWKVSVEEDRIVTMMFNLFALPIVQAGKWLSRKFSSINLFAFVLDFIIETPFKLLLQFSDAFVSFLKEKQEDVY
ncbi:MAG: hypothetical protein V4467_00805 [Patescibacteria group bacterium]